MSVWYRDENKNALSWAVKYENKIVAVLIYFVFLILQGVKESKLK